MEFSLTQEQQDIKSLAAKILADLAPPESLPDFEQPTDWFDERLWWADNEQQYNLMFEGSVDPDRLSIAALEMTGTITQRADGLADSPGRLEVVGRHPLIVLDGAHNPAAAEALAAALREAFAWTRLHLVVGEFTNKDLGGVLRALAPLADAGYATAVASVRARSPKEVARAMAAESVSAEAFGTVREALAAARAAAAEDDLILVTGSLYTVADARRALQETQ